MKFEVSKIMSCFGFFTSLLSFVLQDGICKVAMGQTGTGDILTVNPSEMELVVPRKSDRIKIIQGELRNSTGKLIGIDNADGIVKMDDTLDVKIFDMSNLARMYS